MHDDAREDSPGRRGAAAMGSAAAAGRRWRLSAAVPVTLLLLYSTGLLDHDLWTPDEPRVASVSLSVSEGSWVVPRLGDKPFLEQPPLHAWLVALVYKTLGASPPALGRLVSALLAAGSLLWTYLLARRLALRFLEEAPAGLAHRAGLLAALCLGLSFRFYSTGHRIVVDGALTFFTTGAAYALVRGLTARQGERRWGWLLAAYSMTSLAFLSKGVLGIAFPALCFFAIAIALREPRLLLRARLWLAPLAFAAIAGPWLLLLYREAGAEALREVLIVNTIGRALPVAYGVKEHVHPVFYYLLRTPFGLLPATFFAAGAVARWTRLSRGGEKTAYGIVLWWFFLGMLLLSAASTKRAVYALPLFPAAAVAGGFWLEGTLRRRIDGAYPRLVYGLLVLSLPLGGAAVAAAAPFLKGSVPGWAVPAPFIGAAIAMAARQALREGRRERVLECWLAGLLAVGVCARLSLVPAIDRAKSLGELTCRIAARVPEDREIHVFLPDETTLAVYPLYAHRRAIAVPSLDALHKELARGRGLYLVTTDKRLAVRASEPFPPTRKIQYPRVRHLNPKVLWKDFTVRGRNSRLLYFPPASGSR